jgi:hypothetical protein
MTATLKLAPVRKSITVEARLNKAFEVFTAGIGRWWPVAYSIGKSPIKDVVIERHSGERRSTCRRSRSDCCGTRGSMPIRRIAGCAFATFA